MKKNLALLMVFFAGFFALQGCDEKKIDFDKLPSAAQAFITQYFPGEEVTYAERDKDDGQKDYKVRLSDGTEIEFDENGNWTSVDCGYSALPDGILPAAATECITAKYPDAKAYKVEKEYGGYDVHITTGQELVFNSNWEFVRVSTGD